jgi:8-oxo-dGTP pyrophosphatase MutT (NUDIX family)
MIKHTTSSVFVFSLDSGIWKTLLINHKKLNKWMIPGGHVEPFENPAEAAIREVKEETGIDINLVSFIHVPLPPWDDSTWVLPPEFIYDEKIPAYGTNCEHVHVDCLYIGIASSVKCKMNKSESNDIFWYSICELTNLNMFETTRRLCEYIVMKLELDPKKALP